MSILKHGPESEANRAMAAEESPEPEVGMGATIILWSDRHAATIVKIDRKRSGVISSVSVQRDLSIRKDVGEFSSAQEYEYERSNKAEVEVFKRNGKGAYRSEKGYSLRIGIRSSYHDYLF